MHIVLLEPEIPQNTGNIARSCAAIGAELHLIEPMGFSVSQKEVKRAGLDYWHLVKVSTYASWEDFCTIQSEMDTDWELRTFYLSTKARYRYDEVSYPRNCYLVFGKETAGLPEPILNKAGERLLRIPIRREARSLNLSNAVAVCAFEAMRQWDFEGMSLATGQETGRWRNPG